MPSYLEIIRCQCKDVISKIQKSSWDNVPFHFWTEEMLFVENYGIFDVFQKEISNSILINVGICKNGIYKSVETFRSKGLKIWNLNKNDFQ